MRYDVIFRISKSEKNLTKDSLESSIVPWSKSFVLAMACRANHLITITAAVATTIGCAVAIAETTSSAVLWFGVSAVTAILPSLHSVLVEEEHAVFERSRNLFHALSDDIWL